MTQFDPERPRSSTGAPGSDPWPPQPGASPTPPVWTPPDVAAQQAEWAAQTWQPVPGSPTPGPTTPGPAAFGPPGAAPRQVRPTATRLSPADESTWSVLAHAGVPFFGVLSAGLIYLLLRDRGDFVRANAAEALNWSIVYTIATLGCSILTTVYIGAVLWPLVFVAAVVFGVLGATAAKRGEVYRYPFTWPLAR